MDGVEQIFDADVAQRDYEQNKEYILYGGTAIVATLLFILFTYVLCRKCRKRSKNDFESSKISDSSLMDIHSPGTDIYPSQIIPFLSKNYDYKPKSMFSSSERQFPAFNNNGSSTGTDSQYNPIKYHNLSNSLSSAGSDLTQQTTVNSSGNMASATEDSGNSGNRGSCLTEKTFSKQCRLIHRLGNDHYSRFWLAERKGDLLAVKIYMSRDYRAFDQEVECYSKSNMRHVNILRHFGSEFTSARDCTEHWTASEYLPLGSLYDYLSNNTITSIDQMLSLYRDLSSGLFHLHRVFRGTDDKLGVAHRNLKSKNILMRSPTQCCIGDFGLSVLTDNNGTCTTPKSDLIPYPRYMAPEVLNQSITPEFYKYCAADV